MSKVIYVKTSDTCNLHCDHCFTSGRDGGKDRWNASKTVSWINDFSSKYADDEEYVLVFHGGEPMLADLGDMHWFMDQYEDKPNYFLTISTNLVYKLTPERLGFLERIGSVGTSWDMNTRFENQKQKDLFKRNLRTLKENDIEYHIFVTINRDLVDSSIDAFLDEMNDLAPATIRLERLTVNGNAERNAAIFPDNEVQDNWFVQVYKRYKERRKEFSFSIITLDIIEEKISTQLVKVDTNCRNCEQNFVTMNSDGTLAGCPNSAAQKQHAHVDSGVDAFLSSEGRSDEITHELSFNPNCLECDVFHLCGGDCHKLPWQGDRCGGLKNLLRYIQNEKVSQPSIINAVQL